MMGEQRVIHEALFYGFSRERRVPDNHLAVASGLRGRRGDFAANSRTAYAVDAGAHGAVQRGEQFQGPHYATAPERRLRVARQ